MSSSKEWGGLSLTDEEQFFTARLGDLLTQCREKSIPRFSSFLDERQQVIARLLLQKEGGEGCLFYGGHPQAERQMLGVFPSYQQPDFEDFPILPLTVSYRVQDTLSHRDFLGALMGLRIKREAVGDILLGDGLCVLFITPTLAPVVLEEMDRVGRVGVKIAQGLPSVLPGGRGFSEISGTVSSLRLDCVVALLLNASREKASDLVKSGLVQVNAIAQATPAALLQAGDKLSVRGAGKFLLEEIGNQTKKGRIHLTCKKYL